MLSLIFVHQVIAQKSYEFHGGLLTSQFSGDGFNGYRKFGFTGGAGVLMPLKKEGHFFALGLNYIQKGARDRKNEEEGDFNDYSLQMDYLELPVTYWLPIWGVYFEGGLSAAYRVKFKQLNNGIPAVAPVNLRRLELGLQAGFNVQINDHLLFGFKVLNSLTPVYSNASVPANFWFQQGGMHSVLMIDLKYFLTAPNFVWIKKKSNPEGSNKK